MMGNAGTFIGTKLVVAQAMTRQEYNDYRGWQLPEDEAHLADEAGYLVEYVDGGRANDARHEGYISWSPADVFEKSYRPSRGISFSAALQALKAKLPVQRDGWNGKGMFVYLVAAGRYPPVAPIAHQIAAGQEDGRVPYGPYLAMKTATGEVVPWLASQTDILAEDWSVYGA
jgi:hypothetical protein